MRGCNDTVKLSPNKRFGKKNENQDGAKDRDSYTLKLISQKNALNINDDSMDFNESFQ